jgi:hypothetical protein
VIDYVKQRREPTVVIEADQGWNLSDVTPCFFANMYRGARLRLEEKGLMKSRENHENGAHWIFWAEEPEDKNKKKRSKRS